MPLFLEFICDWARKEEKKLSELFVSVVEKTVEIKERSCLRRIAFETYKRDTLKISEKVSGLIEEKEKLNAVLNSSLIAENEFVHAPLQEYLAAEYVCFELEENFGKELVSLRKSKKRGSDMFFKLCCGIGGNVLLYVESWALKTRIGKQDLGALLWMSEDSTGKLKEFLEKNWKCPGDATQELIAAVESDHHYEAAKIIVDKGAGLNGLFMRGKTPLFFACMTGAARCTDLLVRNGADVNVVDADGYTALVYAVCGGHYECVKILLEGGAHVNHTNLNGSSALMLACTSGYIDCARILIDYGADLNVISAGDGQNILMYTIMRQRSEIAKLLIEKGCDVFLVDNEKKTSLELAEDYNLEEIARILKQKTETTERK